MAESLFFPNGASKSLKLENHVCFISDFSQNELDQDCTVEDLYEKNKVKILRLYLCTKYAKRHAEDKDNSTDTSPATTSVHKKCFSGIQPSSGIRTRGCNY